MPAFAPPKPDELVQDNGFTPPAPDSIVESEPSALDKFGAQMERPARDSLELAQRSFTGVVENGPGQTSEIGTEIQKLASPILPLKWAVDTGKKIDPISRIIQWYNNRQFENSQKSTFQSVRSAGQFLKGANDSVNHLTDFFTSPLGVSTLGIGALPATAQRIVAGAFAAQMASQVPEQSRKLATALVAGDMQAAGETATDMAASTMFTVLGGTSALVPGESPMKLDAKDWSRLTRSPDYRAKIDQLARQGGSAVVRQANLAPQTDAAAKQSVELPQSSPQEPPAAVGEQPKPPSVVQPDLIAKQGFTPPKPEDIYSPLAHVEGELGTIRLKSGDKSQQDSYGESYSQLQKNRPGLFGPAGSSVDQVVQSLNDAGFNHITTDNLFDELLMSHKESARVSQTPEAKADRFQVALDKNSAKKSKEVVSVGDMSIGDKFEIGGEQFEVTHIDPDTGEVTVKDGRKFGSQTIPDGADIPTDKGSMDRVESSVGFLPPEKESLVLAEPESVEEQKARMDSESDTSARKEQAQKLADLAAKPLIGSVGDIGQADMLGGGDLLSIAPKTTEAVQAVTKATPKPIESKSALSQHSEVKVTAPQGATQIRVTTADGKTATRPISEINKSNPFHGVDISKVEAGTIDRSGKFKPVSGDFTVEPRVRVSEGPGAASPGDVPQGSELAQLTASIEEWLPSNSPLEQQVGLIGYFKDKLGDAKSNAMSALARTKATGDAIWRAYTQLPKFLDEQRAVGKWTYALQKADFEAREFGKEITKAVPDKLRREAITNWIQADGDSALLSERANASSGTLKRGYELALELTPEERTLADNIQSYLESMLQRGMDEGILGNGVENYVNQVWKKENQVTQKLLSDFAPHRLQTDFKYAKKRVFESYFEGEQAGFKPANKDVGALVALYDQSFNKVLAARGFLKDLHEGNASDGRPLVEISGSGRNVENLGQRSLEQGTKTLINPRAKDEDTWDYRSIDHPAMRGWKYIGKDAVGNPILLDGQLLVHPETYARLRNRLQRSAWRTYTVPGTDIQPGRILLETQANIKGALLSLSGFHQVQETVHALGHRVNPARLDALDFDEPDTKALVEHGLQLASYDAMEAFGEGLGSGPWVNKIPWLGNKILKPYTEYLFQDYIPRLKTTMAREALERNMDRYADDIASGKVNVDQIQELTAREANAAFGEQNYRYLGRSQTLQDTLRAFLLAPDFLESRARFVGQAAKPFGREQLVALGLIAATQYFGARLLNKMLDGDYHFDKPFRVVVGGKEYGLRTIPTDMEDFYENTRRFSYNRMSPALRTGVEYVTGRDDRGVKRDALEQVKDAANLMRPISTRWRDDQNLWEAFINSMGVREQRFSAITETQQSAHKFRDANSKGRPFEEIYDAEKDEYRPLRIALESGDYKKAQAAYDKLKAGMTPSKIAKNLRSYYTRPFTGSRALEGKFIQQLDKHAQERYAEAKQSRIDSLNRFYTLQK